MAPSFPTVSEEPSISPSEIGRLTHTTPKTVRTQLRNGTLAVHWTRIGKQYRCNRAEVYALLGIDPEEA